MALTSAIALTVISHIGTTVVATSAAQAKAVIPIYHAVRDGTVDVRITGRGSSSGASILMWVARGRHVVTGPITLSVPTGTILRSSDSTVQTMVVARVLGKHTSASSYEPSDYVTLGSDPVIYVLSAYCAEFNKSNPSISDTFDVAQPDPALTKLLTRGKGLTVSAMQAAVWMHTDSITFERMSSTFPISRDDWMSAQRVFLDAFAAGNRELRTVPPRLPAANPAQLVGDTVAAPFGLTLAPLTDDRAQSAGLLLGKAGAVVVDVDYTAAAHLAGVRRGDIVLEVSQEPVRSVTDVLDAIKRVPPEAPVFLLVWRAPERVFLTIRRAAKTQFAPANETNAPSSSSTALTNADILALLDGRLSSEVIILKIQNSQVAFDNSIEALLELKRKGADDQLIAAIVRATALNGPTTTGPTKNSRETPERRSVTATDIDIDAAILKGKSRPGEVHGLHLTDAENQFMSGLGTLLDQQGHLQPGTSISASGFQVTIFTPFTWIAQQAADATEKGRSFTRNDVTADMLRSVLRVRATPSEPPASGPNFGLDVSSVTNVLLSDSQRRNKIQAAARRPVNFGKRSGLTVEFLLSDVNKVRSLDPEFVLVVSGPAMTKAFKVKEKHFGRLIGLLPDKGASALLDGVTQFKAAHGVSGWSIRDHSGTLSIEFGKLSWSEKQTTDNFVVSCKELLTVEARRPNPDVTKNSGGASLLKLKKARRCG